MGYSLCELILQVAVSVKQVQCSACVHGVDVGEVF